jgi:hypothetical protein
MSVVRLIRPLCDHGLAEAAAENVEGHSPHAARGSDVSVNAGVGRVRVHRLWQPQARRGSHPRRPCPGIELLLREGRGRPAQAEEPASLPQLPRTKAEARALDWDQLKALVVAYPEIEYVPERKWKQWLVSRWVGLTQVERDSFRAALDAADATRAEHSVV